MDKRVDKHLKRTVKKSNSEYRKRKRVNNNLAKDKKPALPPKYRSYLNRANKKSMAFDLSIEEFEKILSMQCVYCGGYNRMTIDRIDSSGGYTQDNVQPCCNKCNMMKYTHDHADFLDHILKIYKHSLR